MKFFKKVLTAVLTGAIIFQGLAAPLTAYAAAEAQARAAADGITVTAEKGLKAVFTGADTAFAGTPLIVNDSAKIAAFKENIRDTDTMNISVTFKLAAGGSHELLEICNSAKNSNANLDSTAGAFPAEARESMSLWIRDNGQVYLMTGAKYGWTNGQAALGASVNDGQFHTLNARLSADGAVFRLDQGEEKPMQESAQYKTKEFLAAFFGGASEKYTDWRGNIDSVAIGGLHDGSYQTLNGHTNLNGEIKSLSIGLEDAVDVTMESGLKAGFFRTSFNGTNAVNINDAAQMALFQENVKEADALQIKVAFQMSSEITGGTGRFVNLLDIYNSAVPAEGIGLLVEKADNGRVGLMTGGSDAGTDWIVNCGQNLNNSDMHTLTLTIRADGMSFQMDGGDVCATDNAGTGRNTKAFVQAFFGAAGGGSSYTDWRSRIDTITVGGFRTDNYWSGFTNNLKGKITELSVGRVTNTVISGGGLQAGMFGNDLLDNTWLFGGGAETQGRFEEIGGARNYIGHFEEYVRWDKRVDSVLLGMQRYMINAASAGQDASAFAGKLDSLIARAKPKAVAYLVGAEDYSKGEAGIGAFKEGIASILNTSLGMNENQGYAVLQLPHAVQAQEANAKIKLYVDAAMETFNEIASEDAQKAERMVLVDHWSLTKDDSGFQSSKLTRDGLLNDAGHEEIAKQFSNAVYGSAKSGSYLSGSWTAKAGPQTYLDTMPAVTASVSSLNVTMPDAPSDAEWKYILTINGTRISGSASGGSFVIRSLPRGESYQLSVQTKDGSAQYAPAAGTIRAGDQAAAPEIEGEIPKAIRQKAENKGEPLTWVFMGDSITHGAAWTSGRDSIAQLFEKYVKEDLGRKDDLVINTAVSGAMTDRTLQNIEQRVLKYHPDIVSIMLGTNDAPNAAANPVFKDNLKEIVRQIRQENEDVMIIFRSPTPGLGGWKPGPEGENGSVARMKAVAEEDGNILFIDQFTEWDEEGGAYSYLFDRSHYLGDGSVHASPAGHAWMTTEFIRACGLDMNTRIANFAYEFSYAQADSAIKPDVTKSEDEDAVTVSKAALQTKYGASETIGDIEVTLTDADGRTYTKQGTLGEDAVTIDGLPGGNYTVKVVANIKGSVAKKVTFADTQITLTPAIDPDQEAADGAIDKINAIGEVKYDAACKEKIDEARAAYNALTDEQKALVGEVILKQLTDAEEEYERLEEEAEKLSADQEAANGAIDKINAIGEVKYDAASKGKIDEARAAYEALTDEQKELVDEEILKKLTDAEKKYERLETEAADQMAADQTAANGVIAKINAIGAVSNTAACQQKIDAAKAAYEKLTVAQKKLVPASVLRILTNAQTKLEDLKREEQTKKDNEIKSFVSGNYKYAVTGENTVEVTGAVKKKSSIVIPNDVTYNNRKYTVTAIAANAFKNDRKATRLTVGKNVETIGDGAFSGCRKIDKAAVNSARLAKIGKKAFYNCKALKNIIIKSKKLKSVGGNAFKGISKKAKIKVPSSKWKAYNKTFKNKGQSKSVKIIK